MSKRTTTPDELGSVLDGIIAEYAEDIAEACDRSAESIAKYGAGELKTAAQNAGIKGRKYINSFRAELLEENPLGNVYVIRSTQYRIAHLLEHGHLIVSHGKITGKRTRSFRHWSKVEEDVSNKLEEAVKAAIKRQN